MFQAETANKMSQSSACERLPRLNLMILPALVKPPGEELG